jgi:hypothetical protein
MTTNQESHLQSVKDQFVREVDAKYRKGAAEHGGNLTDAPTLLLLEWLMEEAVDQYVYACTAKAKLLREQQSQSA